MLLATSPLEVPSPPCNVLWARWPSNEGLVAESSTTAIQAVEMLQQVPGDARGATGSSTKVLFPSVRGQSPL